MDARVDNDLGDSISVTFANEVVRPLRGFVNIESEGGGRTAQTPTCKIRKDLVPGGVAAIRRVSTPKLAGAWRPAADTTDDDGVYLIFDLQKAS